MKLELLPNEIFLDIFDYLNGVDLLLAFYGLNSRFNNLLYNQFRSFRFEFNSLSKRQFDIICQQHLPFIADQIIALSLSDIDGISGQINLFFSSIPSLKQFTHLRSLSLSDLNSYETQMRIIEECHHLPHLTHLRFVSCFYSSNSIHSQILIDNIWSLPKLNHCDFDMILETRNYFCIPTKISSSIERLSLSKCQVKLNEISKLFECTPRLKHLSVTVKFNWNTSDYVPCSLPTLIGLKICILCINDISNILSLLQNMFNLRTLDIDLASGIIDGYKWEQLISNYLPNLKKFQFSMMHQLSFDQDKQEQINNLIDSFRNSFWIDKHRWFIRCLSCERTLYLYTSSKTLTFYKDKFPDSFISTQPDDNLQRFADEITVIVHSTFFDSPIPSYIRLTNIKHLKITLPINNQFLFIVPRLNQLYSLQIFSSHINFSQSQLQALLDRAPYLHLLVIYQKESSPSPMSLFKCTNASIRKLKLKDSNHCFNEKECMTLACSQLGVQCEELSISVTECESIVYLVKNMINLKFLNVRYRDKYYKRSLENEEGEKSQDPNTNKLTQWLNDHLPSAYLVVNSSRPDYDIQIWIK